MDSITRCSSTRQMVASDEDTTPTYALDALVANLSIDATPVGNIGGDAGGDAREGLGAGGGAGVPRGVRTDVVHGCQRQQHPTRT